MKFNKTFLVLVASVMSCQLMVAQPTPSRAPVAPPDAIAQPSQPVFQQRLQQIQQKQAEPLPTFTLDFPGGTPAQLIAAIEKVSNHPVNAVIPTDLADMQLPPLKLWQVNVPQLFEALRLASTRREKYVTGTYSGPGGQSTEQYQQKDTSYGFRSQSPGPDAIWYFYYDRVDQPSLPRPVSRFYNLDTTGRNYSIQDITTAIKTGWELLGIKDQPTLKYHPETKLLIAVGQHDHLQLIDSVLRELGMRTDPSARPAAPVRPDSPTPPGAPARPEPPTRPGAPTPPDAPKKDGDSRPK